MDRIRVALQKLKREQGAPEKKLPAGPKEIAEAKKLGEEWGLSKEDQAILAAALNTGCGYMLRAGEFLYRDGRGWDFAKVARGGDIEVKESDG